MSWSGCGHICRVLRQTRCRESRWYNRALRACGSRSIPAGSATEVRAIAVHGSEELHVMYGEIGMASQSGELIPWARAAGEAAYLVRPCRQRATSSGEKKAIDA